MAWWPLHGRPGLYDGRRHDGKRDKFVVLALVLLIWVLGLAAIGALGFWAVRKLSARVGLANH